MEFIDLLTFVGSFLPFFVVSHTVEGWSANGCFTTRNEGTITAQCWEDGDVLLYGEAGNRITIA
jgi:hypothetical protein